MDINNKIIEEVKNELNEIMKWIYNTDSIDNDIKKIILSNFKTNNEEIIESYESFITLFSYSDILNKINNFKTYSEILDKKINDFHLKFKTLLSDLWVPDIIIGRKNEMDFISEFITNEESYTLGLNIFGKSGYGKSAILKNVYSKLDLKKTKGIYLDLSNVNSVNKLIKLMLNSFNEIPPETDIIEKLYRMLYDTLYTNSKKHENIIIFLDNANYFLPDTLYLFLVKLYRYLLNRDIPIINIKFISTTHERLYPNINERYSEQHNLYFNDQSIFFEFHLPGLNMEDSVSLLYYLINSSVPNKVVERLIKSSEFNTGSPELIKKWATDILSKNLIIYNEFISNTNTLNLDYELYPKYNTIIDELLKSNYFPYYLKNVLIEMSVFNCYEFDFTSISIILGGPCVELKHDEENKEFLDELISWNLIKQKDELYIVHPFVISYINTILDEPENKKRYTIAVNLFIKICEKIILDIMFDINRDYNEYKKMQNYYKNYIKLYYSIFYNYYDYIDPYYEKASEIDIYDKDIIFTFAKYNIDPIQMKRICCFEANKSLQVKDDNMYIFWMIKLADIFISYYSSFNIAKEIINKLSIEYKDEFNIFNKTYKLNKLIHVLFNNVKAACMINDNKFTGALLLYNKTLDLLKCLKNIIYNNKTYIINLNKLFSELYLNMGDIDKANFYIKEIHSILNKEYKDSLIIECPYRFNIHSSEVCFISAKIHLKQIQYLNEETEEKNKLCYSALNLINDSLLLDKLLQIDYLYEYYEKLLLKSEIYIMLNVLDKALNAALISFNSGCKMLLHPSNINYIKTLYQLGKIYKLMGNKKNVYTSYNLKLALEYFNDVLNLNSEYGVYNPNSLFVLKIKSDHIDINKKLNKINIENINNRYEDLKSSYANSTFKKNKILKKMMWLPNEIPIKKIINYESEFEKFLNTEN